MIDSGWLRVTAITVMSPCIPWPLSAVAMAKTAARVSA